jgi:hypothetical protein
MAFIVHSEAAPPGEIVHTLAAATFSLGGSKNSFQTDDYEIISNAQQHPWLTVQDEDVPAPATPVVRKTSDDKDKD